MKKIGILFCDTGNPFWLEKIALYRELAPSFGFDIAARFAGDSRAPDGQRRELLRMAEESYDAVIINPLTGDNLFPVLCNLPFPAFDVGPKCDPEKTAGIERYFPIPVTDFEEQGFLAGDELASELKRSHRRFPKSADEGWGLILGGFRGARHSSLRCRGAFRAFRKIFAPERIVTVYADFNGEDAFRAVKELAPKLDLQAIFCANDLMALGAIEALRKSPSGSAALVGGVDAIPGALEALGNGALLCTVRLPHREVVNGVYQAVSDWFKGIPLSGEPLARSVLVRRP